MKLLPPILAACVAFFPTAWALAAPPPPFEGRISAVSDADTVTVERGDKSRVKVRVRWIDAPEVAHNKNQTDQPDGQAATGYVISAWYGRQVHVKPTGVSYGRLVGNITLKEWTQDKYEPAVGDFATDLVGGGWAMLDPRYKPPEILRLNQSLAKENKRGIWRGAEPIPPWTWRAMTRQQQIEARKKLSTRKGR